MRCVIRPLTRLDAQVGGHFNSAGWNQDEAGDDEIPGSTPLPTRRSSTTIR